MERDTTSKERRPGNANTKEAHAASPSPSAAHPLLKLQSAVGNQAVQALVQTKLRVNAPGDSFEREADAVAHQVVSGGREPIVQRQTATSAPIPEAPPQVEATLHSSGSPLPLSARREMEGRFGQEFGQVQVHTDSQAARSAEALQAEAYTSGSHIAFASGRFAPETSEGKCLLAHELTHVVQQQQGATGIQREPAKTTPKPIVLNTDDWIPEEQDTILSFISEEKRYFVPGTRVVYRIPPQRMAEIRQVYGIPATSASGSALVTTGNGQAIIYDAGTNRGASLAVYEAQVRSLAAQVGATSVSSLEITHAHLDHTNRLESAVRMFNIPASNIIIPDFQARWSNNIREQWDRLANDPDIGPRLGYDRTRPGAALYSMDPNAQYYRIRFQRGDLVIEYRTLAQPAQTLASQPLTNPPSAKIMDSASNLISLRQSGSDFKMMLVGDLRGRDIAALKDAMEQVKPGSFAQMFYGVQVIGGMQHHLGVVENLADVRGIRDLLEVTGLSTGRLEAVVQTDNTQMRPRLVEALNLLGVDVSVTMTGNETTGSSATVSTTGQVNLTGPAAQRFAASDANRQLMQRVAQLREQERIFRQYRGNFQHNAAETARIETEFQQARQEVEALYSQRLDQTVGRLGQAATRSAMDAVQFDQAALNANAGRINAERAVDRSLKTGELATRLEEFARMERHAAELDREIAKAVRSGVSSARLLELISIVSPEYARAYLEREPNNARGRRNVARALMRQARTLQAMQTGMRPVRGGTAINLVLLGIEVANQVAPLVNQEQVRRQGARFDAYRDLLWWAEKGVMPRVTGVIDRWGRDDEVYEDIPTIMAKLKENELSALTLDEIKDEGKWGMFTLWVTNNVENYDEYHAYFGDSNLAVKHEGEDFNNSKWFMRVWEWDDSVFGGGMKSKWAHNETLSRIMNATASRVIEGTTKILQQAWENRAAPRQPEPPQLRAAGSPAPIVSGAERQIPVGRRKFKPDAGDKSLYTVFRQHKMLEGDAWWDDEPEFFEVDAQGVPADYTPVMGANYNTYAAIRQAQNFVRDTRLPVTIWKVKTDNPFVSPERETKEERDAMAAVVHGNAEYDRSDSSSLRDGVVHFPGWIENVDGIGLVKTASLTPRVTK